MRAAGPGCIFIDLVVGDQVAASMNDRAAKAVGTTVGVPRGEKKRHNLHIFRACFYMSKAST